MSTANKYTSAVNFLISHAVPTEEQIDAMSDAEVIQYLSENGVDVPKLNARIAEVKGRLVGKMALADAKRCRLSKARDVSAIDVSALSQEDIVKALVRKYGSLDKVPIAARNFKALSKEEWQSLYIDLIVHDDNAAK